MSFFPYLDTVRSKLACIPGLQQTYLRHRSAPEIAARASSTDIAHYCCSRIRGHIDRGREWQSETYETRLLSDDRYRSKIV